MKFLMHRFYFKKKEKGGTLVTVPHLLTSPLAANSALRIGSIGCRFMPLHACGSWVRPLDPLDLVADNMQYVYLNAFDSIAGVFYSGILSLKMAF
jgi:hypothetical protein